MQMVIKCLLAFLWLVVVPALSGVPVLQRKKQILFPESILTGYVVMFSAAELLTLPMIYLDAPLHVLVWILGGFYGGMAVWGIWYLCVKRRSRFPKFQGKLPSVYMLLVLALLAVQIYTIVAYAHFDADDSFYVGTATTGVYTDTIFSVNPYVGAAYKALPGRYLLSQYPTFLSVISLLCNGLHPAILAHTVLAAVFLVLAYLVQYLFACRWFPKKSESRWIYVLFLVIMCSFSAYSKRSAADFQMIRIWQGKAVLASVFLPFFFYLWLDFFRREGREYPWYLLLLTDIGCCYLSSMGILLSVITAGIFLILYLLRYRDVKGFVSGVFCTVPSILLGLIYIFL